MEPRPSGMAGLAALALTLPPAPSRWPLQRDKPRHLTVVEPGTLSPTQKRRRGRLLLIGGLGAGAAVAFSLVYLHVLLAQRQFGIDRVEARVQAEQQAYQDLRLQVAELGSPQHIISMAEGQLGMQEPTKIQYLVPDSSLATGGASGLEGLGRHLGPSPAAPAGDADWPVIKSQLAGQP